GKHTPPQTAAEPGISADRWGTAASLISFRGWRREHRGLIRAPLGQNVHAKAGHDCCIYLKFFNSRFLLPAPAVDAEPLVAGPLVACAPEPVGPWAAVAAPPPAEITGAAACAALCGPAFI
ncbi:unnamed protein product, partial [Ectocarpus sp. 6 AP-2014]